MTVTGAKRAAAAFLLLAVASAAANSSADRHVGERIYRDGLNARGEPVRALVAMPPSPLIGASAACGVCHVLGGSTAPVDNAAPDLRWPALQKAAAAKGSSKPYTEAAFGRAVAEGISPSGEQVSSAMPRYSLSRSEIAALVAYLKTLPANKN